MPARLPSFWFKVILAVGVVALADGMLFLARDVGVNVAIVLTAATAVLALARPAVWRDRLGRWALLAALLLGLLPAERPSPVGLGLWVMAIAVATLAPRAGRGEDGWRWGQRLVAAGGFAFVLWLKDLRILLTARARGRPTRLTAMLLTAALPVIGGVIFLELFAAANPVIARWQGSFSFPELDGGRIVFWLAVAFVMATMLRPRSLRRTMKTPGIEGDLNLPGVTAASITLSLAVFNAVFAVQNGLDVAYLWAGAGALPEGVTFADYAHQGAYPLIATALLAGLFVLLFLRPGSETAARPLVRWLVIAWVAQNVFLVASTALRTLDYIDAYSLTGMRIAALMWMGLVATGLMLILWRLLRRRSSGWLINANLIATGLVLAVCSVIDLGAIAAAWNVRHAREAGGAGASLDLCYLQDNAGGAALVSLAELERRSLSEDMRERVVYVRGALASEMAERQADWRSWRWRDARRLARTEALVGPSTPPHRTWSCAGLRTPPVARRSDPPPTPPLTPAPNPRT